MRVAGAVLACLVFVCMLAQPALGRDADSPQKSTQDQQQLVAAINQLPLEYRQWVKSVLGLITVAELEYFLDLSEEYRRDIFMETFWQARDPFPETRVNELRERWQELTQGGAGASFSDARFMLYLLNGPPGNYILPNGAAAARCFSRSQELEIWFYGQSERVDHKFLVILLRRSSGAPYEPYHLGDPIRPTQRSGGLPTTEIRDLCADDYLRWAVREISQTPNYESLLDKVLTPPLPSAEWIASLGTSSTDLPKGAETFDLEVDLRFPKRRQSRTAMQVMLMVPMEENPGQRFEGELFYDFLIKGEVLREGRLFESFRYHFEGPLTEEVLRIPLGFTRYLRPGPATLQILVQDVFTGRYAQVVREIEVPDPEGLPKDSAASTLADLGLGTDSDDTPSLRLLDPPGEVHAGMVRFRTRARGEFERVTFWLDGKEVLTKRRPPYSVELDLGKAPTPHTVRVVGFIGGQEAASDQLWLNHAGQRFAVRFVEPQTGGIYPGSVTVRVDVQTPDGQAPERVELYLNDEQVAVIEEPPYVRSLRLASSRAAVIKTVAILADGSSAEDAVIVNGSEFVAEVEVQLVELFPLVVDDDGRPLLDLAQDEFRVLEDGVPQHIRRFQTTQEAPIHAALLIDRSVSMVPHLGEVTEAALRFARAAVRSPDDRVATLSFADQLSVDADFGSESAAIERSLAGMVAYGGTALYDSVVQALNLFEGIQGHSALLLFSDGQDEDSRLDLEQTLEAARHAGVTLYSVGLREAFAEKAARRQLEELATETGGSAYFISELAELAQIYDEILEELRSRYSLAYQSTSTKPAAEFRVIQVEVERKGATVRTRQGYYP